MVVVGGGAAGLSVAYHLARMGVKVTVLEKKWIGYGASGRNAGGVRAQFTSRENIVLAREGLRLWPKLSAELGFNTLFHHGGYLFLAHREESLEEMKRNVALQNSLGVKSRLLGVEEIREKWPFLNLEGVLGGAFHHLDGSAHHDAVLWGFARKLRELGGDIIEGVEVKRVVIRDGEVAGLETSRGFMATDFIVNAAGPWAKLLAETVGVHLQIHPFRREILVTEPLKHFLDTVIISSETKSYIKQTLRGEVLSSVTLEQPESFNIRSSLTFIKKCARGMVKLCPRLARVRILRQWAGVYDATEDGSPIIGEVEEVRGFFQCNGFSGRGFMLSPIVGKLAAESIVSGKLHPLLKPFRPSRFREGALVVEKAVMAKARRPTP